MFSMDFEHRKLRFHFSIGRSLIRADLVMLWVGQRVQTILAIHRLQHPPGDSAEKPKQQLQKTRKD